MKIGYIGLGKMGRNMVLRMLEEGIKVVVWNRSKEAVDQLKLETRNSKLETNLKISLNLQELVNKLESPRIIWIMLSAGSAVDEMLEKLVSLVSRGDLIIDGGNSFYKDTVRRGELLAARDIRYMDIGTSGGPGGARTGACLMIGGDKKDYKKIEPLVKKIAANNAYGYFGKLGAGHFVKMVHNGIEYGMMEAIAEGAAVLKFGPYKFDLADVFGVYNNRSVIESRLVGWAQEAFSEDEDLSDVTSQIAVGGEGGWTVDTAKEENVPVSVIEGSLNVRKQSQNVRKNSPAEYRNKVVSSLRGKFGQHEVRK